MMHLSILIMGWPLEYKCKSFFNPGLRAASREESPLNLNRISSEWQINHSRHH